MSTAIQSACSELAALVGESRVITDPAACVPYAVDGKTPQSVVYAPSAVEVAAVLKHASQRDLAVIPVRNGTKIGIGNPPRRYDVALSLKEMNRVWYYEPDDLTASVEPGMKLGDLQHLLARHHLWLPLDPPGGDKSSIGGILAANASGALRLRYGTPRDFTIGMKIATTEGKIVATGGRVVKNVAGYDIAKLLIGSYGTLGVIVEASFKLFPLPAGTATFVLAAGTLDQARELRRALQRSALEPMRMALLAPGFAEHLRRNDILQGSGGSWQIWLEAGGSARVLDRYGRELEELAHRAAVPIERRPPDAETADVWRAMAEHQFDPQITERDWLLKASLPIAATEEFMDRARQTIPSGESRLASWAYTSVGIVYLWLKMPAGERAQAELVERLRGLALELGGSLMVELSPSESKGGIDTWGPPGDDFEMMRKMKAAWDPKGILSPGRFVGGL